MMTLVRHRDLLEVVVQVVPLFCPAQEPVEVAMEGRVEWEEVWGLSVAQEDLEVDSLADDPLLVHQHRTLDHTTHLDLGACQALEVEEGEEEVEEDFHQEVHPSLICHPTLAHQCILDRDLTQCYHRELWVVVQVAEGVHHIQGSVCLSNSLHMDKVAIPSTALPYLAVLAPVGLHMAP